MHVNVSVPVWDPMLPYNIMLGDPRSCCSSHFCCVRLPGCSLSGCHSYKPTCFDVDVFPDLCAFSGDSHYRYLCWPQLRSRTLAMICIAWVLTVVDSKVGWAVCTGTAACILVLAAATKKCSSFHWRVNIWMAESCPLLDDSSRHSLGGNRQQRVYPCVGCSY